MPEPTEAEFMQIALPAMKDTTPLVVYITIADAWMLTSALQMATRHPGMGEPLRARITQIAHQFEDSIVLAHPNVRAVLEMGWNPAHDQPAKRRK